MGKSVQTFKYFAYGSNLLAARLKIDNPSAVRYGIGQLENYRLDFHIQSKRWKGATATIAPKQNAHVWGAIWEMDIKDIEHLDIQEGVAIKFYFALEVDVVLTDGTKVKCRTYQHCTETPDVGSVKGLSKDRQPSTVYLNVIKEGAKESKLPADYLEYLSTIPDNGYNGPVDVQLPENLRST